MEFSQVLRDYILPVISVVGAIATAIVFMVRTSSKNELKQALSSAALNGVKESMELMRQDLLLIKENHLRHIETDVNKISGCMIEVKAKLENHLENHNKGNYIQNHPNS